MTDALNKLVALLELETLEETLYRGQSQDLAFLSSMVVRYSAKRLQPLRAQCH